MSNLYKAYQKDAQYGNFEDNSKEGGAISKGMNGESIHVSNIELDLRSANPKMSDDEFEQLLMARNGYININEVPINEITGYREYWNPLKSIGQWARKTVGDVYQAGVDWITGGIKGTYDFLDDKIFQGYLPGGTDTAAAEARRQEAERKEQLSGLLETQMDQLREGSAKMTGDDGWIQEQLQSQLGQFGLQKDLLTTQGDRLDIQEGRLGTQSKRLDTKVGQLDQSAMDARRGLRKQMGAVRGQEVATGIKSTDPYAMEDIEAGGVSAMSKIGAGRQEVLRGREDIEFGLQDIGTRREDLVTREGMIDYQIGSAETQDEMDEYKFRQQTGDAMAQLLSGWMTATGDEIPEGFLSLYESYVNQT